MAWRVLGDLVVALHFAFIVFVAAGGFLTWRWPRVAWLHGIALAWGLWILAVGALCPLTPLENAWRARAGGLGYTGGFIEHYITPVVYPAGLTRGFQALLAAGLIVLNLLAYGILWRRRRGRRAPVA